MVAWKDARNEDEKASLSCVFVVSGLRRGREGNDNVVKTSFFFTGTERRVMVLWGVLRGRHSSLSKFHPALKKKM